MQSRKEVRGAEQGEGEVSVCVCGVCDVCGVCVCVCWSYFPICFFPESGLSFGRGLPLKGRVGGALNPPWLVPCQ